MITEFELMDATGNVLGRGEIDDGVYRLFANDRSTDFEEFESVEAMCEARGGIGIQPMLFQTRARTRQPQLFQ